MCRPAAGQASCGRRGSVAPQGARRRCALLLCALTRQRQLCALTLTSACAAAAGATVPQFIRVPAGADDAAEASALPLDISYAQRSTRQIYAPGHGIPPVQTSGVHGQVFPPTPAAHHKGPKSADAGPETDTARNKSTALPPCAAWFSREAVHEREQRLLPEFFDNSLPGATPEVRLAAAMS